MGEIHRKTAEIELIAKYGGKSESFGSNKNPNQPLETRNDRINKKEAKMDKIVIKSLIIKPGEFYLVKTIESVNMPQNLTASITPRSTTYRSGLFLRTGNVPPGYCGGLIFGLKNEGPIPVEIEMGARFVHIQFHEIKGGGSMYRGQWQGGRITTTKKEKQV